jgi:hypothetical protein
MPLFELEIQESHCENQGAKEKRKRKREREKKDRKDLYIYTCMEQSYIKLLFTLYSSSPRTSKEPYTKMHERDLLFAVHGPYFQTPPMTAQKVFHSLDHCPLTIWWPRYISMLSSR